MPTDRPPPLRTMFRLLRPALASCLLGTGSIHADDLQRHGAPAPLGLVPAAGGDACRTRTPSALGAELRKVEAISCASCPEWEDAAPLCGGDRALPLSEPDRAGLHDDTRRFLGLQLIALAVLYASPEGVSGWSEEQIEAAGFDRWLKNVGKFEWDRDVWWINYALHPYWGAAYYTRARERGFDRAHAFGYSILLSTEYELGAEAFFENPSIQDLLVTPLLGSLLAQGIEPWRHRVRAHPEKANRLERIGLVLSDPLGAINRQLDRLVGRFSSLARANVTVTRSGPPVHFTGYASGGEPSSAGYGDGGEGRWRLGVEMRW